MPVIKLRVEISKDEEIRYISHLDYAGVKVLPKGKWHTGLRTPEDCLYENKKKDF